MLNTNTIQSLINSGEGYNVEFKVLVPSKIREMTEEICAFANADGGYLLIGIDDNGQIVGTDLENDKRSAIQGSISEISPALHCDMYAVNIDDKTVPPCSLGNNLTGNFHTLCQDAFFSKELLKYIS